MCGKLPTPWGSNRSSSNIIDWQFSRLCRFSTNGISLRSGEAEMKKLQRSRQAHFLGTSSPDSFPPDRSALRRSRAWLWGEPASRLWFRSMVSGFPQPKIWLLQYLLMMNPEPQPLSGHMNMVSSLLCFLKMTVDEVRASIDLCWISWFVTFC